MSISKTEILEQLIEVSENVIASLQKHINLLERSVEVRDKIIDLQNQQMKEMTYRGGK